MSALENCFNLNILIMIKYSSSNGKKTGDTPSATLIGTTCMCTLFYIESDQLFLFFWQKNFEISYRQSEEFSGHL